MKAKKVYEAFTLKGPSEDDIENYLSQLPIETRYRVVKEKNLPDKYLPSKEQIISYFSLQDIELKETLESYKNVYTRIYNPGEGKTHSWRSPGWIISGKKFPPDLFKNNFDKLAFLDYGWGGFVGKYFDIETHTVRPRSFKYDQGMINLKNKNDNSIKEHLIYGPFDRNENFESWVTRISNIIDWAMFVKVESFI